MLILVSFGSDQDVVDTVKRFRDGELDPVCNVCNIYLEARCGNLSDI